MSYFVWNVLVLLRLRHDVECPWKDGPILCRLWGHALNEEAAYYYAVFSCDRCGDVYEQDTGLREWVKVRWWLASQRVKSELKDWRYWLRCSDCGRRFGRHDDSQDHIPF